MFASFVVRESTVEMEDVTVVKIVRLATHQASQVPLRARGEQYNHALEELDTLRVAQG